jgi:hypothetical protein
MAWQDAASRIRGRVGASIFERVAGPQGPAHHQVIFAEGGERWFAGDRPIRRVRLPRRAPAAEAALIRPSGLAAVHAIRWATAARPAAEAS